MAHVYDAVTAATRVTVTTTWQGQFWVDGLGPFVVDGAPVTQTARLVVPVRSAVAQLLGTP